MEEAKDGSIIAISKVSPESLNPGQKRIEELIFYDNAIIVDQVYLCLNSLAKKRKRRGTNIWVGCSMVAAFI